MHFEMAFDKKSQTFCPLVNHKEERFDSVNKSKIKESSDHIQHIAVRQNYRSDYNSKTKKLFDSDIQGHCLKCEGYKVIDISPFEWNSYDPGTSNFNRKTFEIKYIQSLFKEQNIHRFRSKQESFFDDLKM